MYVGNLYIKNAFKQIKLHRNEHLFCNMKTWKKQYITYKNI